MIVIGEQPIQPETNKNAQLSLRLGEKQGNTKVCLEDIPILEEEGLQIGDLERFAICLVAHLLPPHSLAGLPINRRIRTIQPIP